jgi:TolB protein
MNTLWKRRKLSTLRFLLGLVLLTTITGCTPTAVSKENRQTTSQLGLAYYSERGADYYGAIYLLDLATGVERRLTAPNEIVTPNEHFSWSPVNQKFAYIGEGGEIYTVDIAGTQRQRLTFGDTPQASPAWSPDGARIAFVRRGGVEGQPDSGYAWRAYVMNADGSAQRQLLDDPNLVSSGGVWSPDSTVLALLVSKPTMEGMVAGILVVDVASGKELARITDRSTCRSPQWSHDGNKLAYVSDRDGEYQLYVWEVRTGKQIKLAADVGNVLSADWSPDDAWLAFSGSASQESFDIYIVRSDGSARQDLTGSLYSSAACQWSPDGQSIAFVAAEGEDWHDIEVYIVQVEDGSLRRVTNNVFPDGPVQWVQW